MWEGDFPDPFVLPVPGGYLAFATNAGGSNVQCLASTDLVSWERRPDALPALAWWASPGHTWAPVVMARPGGWALWVTVRHRRSGRQAITVATADRPQGPYRDRTWWPRIRQRSLGGSIDPSPFVDIDGTAYLVWKADANALGLPSSLWVRRLSEDRTRLEGRATRLLVQDATWEAPLIEAPCLARAGDHYVLWYSAGWWESDSYCIGYATASHPLGPWTKGPGPWMASGEAVVGPGGQETFVAADGRRWLALHGWAPGRVGYGAGGRRTLRLVPVTVDPDGTPRHPS